ncbi:hypothetical protein HY621_00600, partial [Candidatus Uhrbacteria bacterium]|nr:hypothetical protein [Candidatus Uhrbacteria bacterium]
RMTLLQVKVDNKLRQAIKTKSRQYGVPASSLVRIVLIKSFLSDKKTTGVRGNVFNADRDCGGKGILIDELINAL